MNDSWDFSNLFQKINDEYNKNNSSINEKNEIIEEMQKEIENISNQIALLDSEDYNTLNNLNLLCQPKENNINIENNNNNNISVKSNLKKTSNSILKSPRIVTPQSKELSIIKPKKEIQTRKIQKSFTPIFKAIPSELKVVNFQLSMEYVLTFSLQNISSHTNGFQLRTPSDPAFQIKLLENSTNSLIRPGLSYKFEVIFLPTEPRDYEGSITFLPGPDEIPIIITIFCSYYFSTSYS